jgi:hypothetical protein
MRLFLHSFASAWLLSLCFFADVSQLEAATYYVSPTGSDSNNGLSTTTPWQTLTKVNGHTFAAGDQVLFQSGQTFTAPTGSDALIINGAGTSTNPIVYGMYGGTSPAIISQTSASKNGITFSPTNSYVTIQDLTVAGPFAWTANTTTVPPTTPYGIYLKGSSSTALTGTTIQGVIVHNFAGSGIRTAVNQKLANTTITDTQVYQVGDCGIHLGDNDDPQGGHYHTNIYIGHCYVNDTCDSGILVQCATPVTIEYCVANAAPAAFVEPSGTSGAPYGIWFADVAYGTIQYCESYNNVNSAVHDDGGGFDLDGGSQYCVVQYCYAHDNQGPGFLLAHWANAADAGSPIFASNTINNTFRYNISINDAKYTNQAALSFWTENTAATLDNVAYNNLVVQTRAGLTNACIDQFIGTTVGTAADPTRIYNNIFVTNSTHLLANTVNSTHFIINNNIWWSLDNTFDYSGGSLAATDPLGIQADPLINGEPSALLTAPTVGYANIDNIEQALTADFEENTGSPATDNGLNLSLAAYGSQNVGTQDFFGTAIPQNNLFDIGPYEQVNAFSGAVVADVASSPGVTLTGSWSTSTSTSGYYGRYYLTDGDAGTGKSVQFTPNLPTAGTYQVYAWWSAASNRATNVPVSIVSTTGTTPVTVNEQTNGGQWVSLGTYTFNSGTGGSVTISDTGANGYVIADAVCFVLAADVIVDVSGSTGITETGSWAQSTSIAGYYGSYYLTDGDAGGGKSVTFTPTLPTTGSYEVYAWWTANSNRASNVPVSIVSATGTTPVTVNEKTNGGQWVSLGTYTFNSGTGGSVTISDTGANGYVIADAVQFVQQN